MKTDVMFLILTLFIFCACESSSARYDPHHHDHPGDGDLIEKEAEAAGGDRVDGDEQMAIDGGRFDGDEQAEIDGDRLDGDEQAEIDGDRLDADEQVETDGDKFDCPEWDCNQYDGDWSDADMEEEFVEYFPSIPCRRSSDCPDEHYCLVFPDEEYGLCRTWCDFPNDPHCPWGSVCYSKGTCEFIDRYCESIEDCGTDEFCRPYLDHTWGSCEPYCFAAGEQCTVGNICELTQDSPDFGTCICLPCSGGEGCSDKQYCHVKAGETEGCCMEKCQSALDCTGRADYSCSEQGECLEIDHDCGGECPTGYTCEYNTGDCILNCPPRCPQGEICNAESAPACFKPDCSNPQICESVVDNCCPGFHCKTEERTSAGTCVADEAPACSQSCEEGYVCDLESDTCVLNCPPGCSYLKAYHCFPQTAPYCIKLGCPMMSCWGGGCCPGYYCSGYQCIQKCDPPCDELAGYYCNDETLECERECTEGYCMDAADECVACSTL